MTSSGSDVVAALGRPIRVFTYGAATPATPATVESDATATAGDSEREGGPVTAGGSQAADRGKEVADEFYEFTPADYSRLMAGKKEAYHQSPLHSQYHLRSPFFPSQPLQAIIRVRFPDIAVVVAAFAPTDAVAAVRQPLPPREFESLINNTVVKVLCFTPSHPSQLFQAIIRVIIRVRFPDDTVAEVAVAPTNEPSPPPLHLFLPLSTPPGDYQSPLSGQHSGGGGLRPHGCCSGSAAVCVQVSATTGPAFLLLSSAAGGSSTSILSTSTALPYRSLLRRLKTGGSLNSILSTSTALSNQSHPSPTTTSPVFHHLSATHLSATHLSATHLSATHLSATHLSATHLSATHLSATHLSATHLSATHLSATHLSATHLFRNPPLRNPPLRNPPLRNPPLRNPPLRNPPLRNPPLRNPPLRNPPLRNPPLRNPPLRNPPLRNPPLRNPPLRNPPLRNPPLRNPPLRNPPLRNPPLRNPPLRNPPLRNPPLRNPPLRNPPLRNPPLRNPPLRNPPLRNPPLRNPPLRNPPLRNPPLRNPPLRNPPLRNPPLRNPPLRNPPLRNPPLRNPPLRNPPLRNPPLRNPPLRNPPLRNPLLRNPPLRNPLLTPPPQPPSCTRIATHFLHSRTFLRNRSSLLHSVRTFLHSRTFPCTRCFHLFPPPVRPTPPELSASLLHPDVLALKDVPSQPELTLVESSEGSLEKKGEKGKGEVKQQGAAAGTGGAVPGASKDEEGKGEEDCSPTTTLPTQAIHLFPTRPFHPSPSPVSPTLPEPTLDSASPSSLLHPDILALKDVPSQPELTPVEPSEGSLERKDEKGKGEVKQQGVAAGTSGAVRGASKAGLSSKPKWFKR
ncbi:unnamed protein product [Closterium sp. NIES-65]|nr:unnamed protein product [Closterium sp. NIES-65]